jgi:GT2 family glycosyltransferase
MPTAVREIELTALPAEIVGLERYGRCLLLIRDRGRPVGSATVSVNRGRLSAEALQAALRRAAPDTDQSPLERQPEPPDRLASPGGASRHITIAVCSRDRTAELARCLSALLQLPDDGQELLVVDNAPSTEATCQLVARHGRVRYVREDRPGLNVARNRALREARGDLVAFCDDDAVPDRGWLRAIVPSFDDPFVLAVTGLTMPLELETPAQEWFERLYRFGRGFERIVFDRDHPLAERSGAPGVGANMALRRSVLGQLGGFDEALDAGTPTCSGGDNEMLLRILRAGYRVVYDPAAVSWHRHRRAWPELRRTAYGYRVGLYAVWTRQLCRQRDFRILRPALRRLLKHQPRLLARALLRRPGCAPADLRAAELLGCLVGPAAYLVSVLRSASWQRRIPT